MCCTKTTWSCQDSTKAAKQLYWRVSKTRIYLFVVLHYRGLIALRLHQNYVSWLDAKKEGGDYITMRCIHKSCAIVSRTNKYSLFTQQVGF